MIGCVITGHGEFAPGMLKALQMIAGPQEKLEVVAFKEGEPLEEYETEVRQAIAHTLEETEGVIVFSDLLGGTPFRTAMLAAADFKNVQVLTGTNLPMLIEISMLRMFETDAVNLATRATEIGKEGVQHVRLSDLEPESQDTEDSEGI